MKNKAFYNILTALFFATSMLTSCLSDDEETTTVITYSDSAITSFSLGTLTRNLTDSTTTKYNGSDYAFTIDQYNYAIYNDEPLLAGTDKSSIPCNIGTKNSGYLFKVTANGTDSLFTSGDTIDFSKGSREFIVVSSDGTCKAKYTVTITVRDEKAEEMTWYDPVKIEELPEAVMPFVNSILAEKEIIQGHLAVIGTVNGNEYAKDINTDSLYLIKRNSDGNIEQTIKEDLIPGSALPHSNISMTAAPQGKLATIILAKDTLGKNTVLYKPETANGKWMQLSNEYGKNIPDSTEAHVVSYGKYLVALASNNRFYLSDDGGRCWATNSLMYSIDALAEEKIKAFAKDEDNILWIFTESGYAYRCKQNGISWGK